jgi:hypothetical protein
MQGLNQSQLQRKQYLITVHRCRANFNESRWHVGKCTMIPYDTIRYDTIRRHGEAELTHRSIDRSCSSFRISSHNDSQNRRRSSSICTHLTMGQRKRELSGNGPLTGMS